MKHELTSYDRVKLADATPESQTEIPLSDGAVVIAEAVTDEMVEHGNICQLCEFYLEKNVYKLCRINCFRDGSYGVYFRNAKAALEVK